MQDTEGLDFKVAIETLAERYSVELKREQEDPAAERRRERRERLLKLLERTAAYYARYAAKNRVAMWLGRRDPHWFRKAGSVAELARLIDLDPAVLAATVERFNGFARSGFDGPLADGLRYEVEQIQELFERGEAVEGIRAFIDKRAPEFV